MIEPAKRLPQPMSRISAESSGMPVRCSVGDVVQDIDPIAQHARQRARRSGRRDQLETDSAGIPPEASRNPLQWIFQLLSPLGYTKYFRHLALSIHNAADDDADVVELH